MKSLPHEVKAYKQTNVFTEKSVPQGLLKDHRTLPGTWGHIVVLEGRLKYRIQSDPPEELELSPGKFGVVEPQVLHSVEPVGEVKFYVEFYK